MKKAEELKLYAPEPKRPELDAALCMSVAEGQGMGRYIEGKVLTVAVWDKKEKPLVVWRFFGDYWTGELRGNENPTKGELSPRQALPVLDMEDRSAGHKRRIGTPAELF